MAKADEIGFIEQITGLERAYHGLTDAIVFDEQLAETRSYISTRIAEIILSDELAAEIEALPTPMAKAVAGQTVNELCNDLFGSTDYTCSWTDHRQWLGDAIVAASAAV